jgi:hypothetical protein
MPMSEPKFFHFPEGIRLGDIAGWAEAELVNGAPETEITGVAPLEDAGPGMLVFFDNTAYLDALTTTAAAGCLVSTRHKDKVPEALPRLCARMPTGRGPKCWLSSFLRQWSRVIMVSKVYPSVHRSMRLQVLKTVCALKLGRLSGQAQKLVQGLSFAAMR